MKISYEQERALAKGLLVGGGFRASDAEIVSTVITHSDFTGVYSHGLSRLTRYLRQITSGALNCRANFQTVLDGGAFMVFDGDNGSGIVSVNKAYDETLKKAREYGVAISTGRRNANIGCGSYYGWRAAQDDVICLLCCNTYAYAAPFGGADRFLGTNPIVISIPTGERYPMVLDISTTQVAMGKIQAAAREGTPIPPVWANDTDGVPTTDASKAWTLQHIAAHKGYGLSVIVDALSTFLSGAAYGTNIGLFTKLEPENTGFFMMLIDPSKFMPIEEFKATSDDYINMIKSSRLAAGTKEIFLPGELEYKRFGATKETGFEVSEALGAELAELAAGFGIIPEGADFAALLECDMEAVKELPDDQVKKFVRE